jgi:hypothetical protein
MVLPDEEEVLLGAYPLEGMDLMVHPKNRRLSALMVTRRATWLSRFRLENLEHV